MPRAGTQRFSSFPEIHAHLHNYLSMIIDDVQEVAGCGYDSGHAEGGCGLSPSDDGDWEQGSTFVRNITMAGVYGSRRAAGKRGMRTGGIVGHGPAQRRACIDVPRLHANSMAALGHLAGP